MISFIDRLKQSTDYHPAVGWATLIRTIGSLGFALSLPFLAIYLNEDLGIPMTQIGLMLTVSGLIGSSLGALGGSASDHFGRKKLLFPLISSRAIVFVLLAVIVWTRQPFLLLAFLWIFNGILGSSTHPITDAIIADVTPSSKRAEAYSILRVGGNIGWALGPAIGGMVIVFGYHWLFLMTAIALFSSSLIARYKLPETWQPHPGREKSNAFKLFKEDPYVMIFLLICLCVTLVRGQLMATLSVHLFSNVGLSKTQIGIIYFINAGLVTVFQIPIARWIHKIRPLMLMSIAGIYYAAGYYYVGFSKGILSVIVAIVVVTIGEMIESPTSSSYISNLAPRAKSGAYMGAYSLVLMLGWAVGPLLGGFLLDHTSRPVHAWTIISVLALVASTGFFILSRFEKRVLINRKAYISDE